MKGKTFLIDTTKCIACRGCQVACKQWNKNKGVRTSQRGSYQNPPDLDFYTFKLVRFSEVEVNGGLRWYFFPDQCRHCLEPPCKMTAESLGSKAITKDEEMGAVLYNPEVKVSEADSKTIRESCPWDIPRWNKRKGGMAKCTMCIDRIKEGLLPACVKVCPTGTMNFGDRDEMLDMAQKRLKELKPKHPKAQLLNADFMRTVFLVIDDSKKYHKYAAENDIGITRFAAIKQLIKPFVDLSSLKG